MFNINQLTSGKERIICLTEECTETLYLMGEEDRIVGVSTHTVRPPEARKKPRVSTFVKAKVEEIMDLKPDLVIGFSDIQADIAQQLIKCGLEVYIANHRSIQGILKMIHHLGGLIGEEQKSIDLISKLKQIIEDNHSKENEAAPIVYFEEWHDPIITGIQWVSEIIELAGGKDPFPELRYQSLAKDRIITAEQAIQANPDLIFVSWCGKAYNPKLMNQRPNWDSISAVQNGQVHEIHSSIILQPGPACILEGLPLIRSHIKNLNV